MSHTLIVTEGSDDLRALQEIIMHELGFSQKRLPTPLFQREERAFQQTGQERLVHIIYTNGKEPAARITREYIDEGKVIDRGIDRLGLVFDPDKHKDIEWKQWVEHRVLKNLSTQPTQLGYHIDLDGKSIDFIPVPWDAGSEFDALEPGLRGLERVAIGILQESCPADADLVLRMLSLLQSENRKTSWKTAFRLLNAIRAAGVEDGFFSRVFGQDSDLRSGVRPVLQSTQLWARIQFLAGL